MTITTLQNTTRPTEWFATWFDSTHYRKLYAYRDDTEAARFLDALVGRLQPGRGARALDLGCGAGRHSKYLASKGLEVVGMDLSANSIDEAKRAESPHLRFVQHDMRVPFGRDVFDYVFNFFTSFGYFDDAQEHLAVVRNMSASLHAGGRLVLDYLNARYAEARLVPEEVKIIEGVRYCLTRWADDRHFFKRIVIDDGSDPLLQFVERVARFTLRDFEDMFAAFDLGIEEIYGDYALGPYDATASPRMILIARKGETAATRRLPRRSTVGRASREATCAIATAPCARG
jgi:SAM-dependent methyltransferase